MRGLLMELFHLVVQLQNGFVLLFGHPVALLCRILAIGGIEQA